MTAPWITDFVTAAADFQPGFATRIQGASPDQIEALQRFSVHRFPPIYLEFLQAFGANSAGACSFAGAGSTSVTSLLDAFADSLNDPESLIVPPDCILIACGDPAVGEVCLQLADGGGLPLVASSDGLVQYRIADSLPHALHSALFQQRELQRHPFVRMFVKPEMDRAFLAPVQPELEQRQFQLAWFSDSCRLCASNSATGAAVIASPAHFALPGFILATHSRQELDSLSQAFALALGLRLDHQWKG